MESKSQLAAIKKEIINTLSGDRIKTGLFNIDSEPVCKPLTEKVIAACGLLADRMMEGQYDELLLESGLSDDSLNERKMEAAALLSRGSLRRKLKMELGDDLHSKKLYPLGVLLHIGAGNMDGLSAYSVVEGLLMGNINLLKLPEAERGVSQYLLSELVNIAPELKPYIYVFDVPSSDENTMRELADLADGIVVWGGDEAVMAARTLAGPGKKLIEWGHKLSFAYVSGDGLEDEKELFLLARHMIETDQLLCSSCQGIYVDTEEEKCLEHFSRRFLRILEAARQKYGEKDAGIVAQNTLRAYSRQLEASFTEGIKVYRGNGVSVTQCYNQKLELSMMYGNCWVKPLPVKQIVEVLRESKQYLQTVGLLCREEDRAQLSALFCRAGAVRIRRAGDMSGLASEMNCTHSQYGWEAHDGEYPLRRYTKMVEME